MDCYSAHVTQAVPCCEPMEFCFRYHDKVVEGIRKAYPSTPIFVPYLGVEARNCQMQRGGSVADLLAAWGVASWILEHVDYIPCLMLPMPIAFLTLRNEWRELLFLSRWHKSYFAHPEVIVDRRPHTDNPLALFPDWPPAGFAKTMSGLHEVLHVACFFWGGGGGVCVFFLQWFSQGVASVTKEFKSYGDG